MKKFLSKVSVFFAIVFLLGTVGACAVSKPQTNNLPKLSVPNVTIDDNGVASWEKVGYAIYYAYVIDSGAEKITDECKLQLAENESIKVKAVSGSENYVDSDFSQPKTYAVEHEHADNDGDGTCDVCGVSVKAELSFLAVNDLHGKFMDTANQPGLDEFTTYLKNLYSDTSREEVLLSSGDMWQGTVESSGNKGRLMTEWMNEVGFSSMTLGNHEYDWGAQVLTPNSELAKFPFLAINVTYNGQAVNYCSASTVVEKGGIKIGIIGAIGDCLSSISGDFTEGLQFAAGNALTKLVKNEATRLRNEEDCDFIVYSIHEGYGDSFSPSSVISVSQYDIPYYDVSLSDGYVDLVFEGHTHQHYILKDEYGVYHLQGGGENKYISSADVSFNIKTAEYTVTPRLLKRNVYASSSLEGDTLIEEIFTRYFPDENPYTTILGTNNSRKDGEDICEQVARLYYEAGNSAWGDNYDVVLGGGYLKTRSPYSVAAGNVTYADLFSVLPFDNEIVLGRIKGSDLLSKFLQTSNGNYHVYGRITPYEVSNNDYYYIVVDSYTSTYKPNRITEVARLNNGKYARDLLADFISAGGWGSQRTSPTCSVGYDGLIRCTL
ncbi:MAG: 5'-nucleotidase C-terminal domain-containing protein [Clostridia bacterium]|nr:5'-nucleotidase C-terminal domain-containing protein [Clostridia bacterium]